MFHKGKSLNLLVVLSLILAACQSTATPEAVVDTMAVTEVVEAPPVEVVQVVTPTPEPTGPRTLVICEEQGPDLEYIFSINGLIDNNLLDAIHDGPIDGNSYAYQPVILEKLPSLADGDAALVTVVVGEGDRVVDIEGNVVTLDPAAEPPIMLSPAGGGDAVPYQGGSFKMEQLSATFRLLPNLLWSDDEPLTAADSVYAFNLATDPVFDVDYYIYHTASYEAIDDLTIEWTGLPGFLESTYPTFLFRPKPEHIWGQYSAAELLEAEELALAPVGWGPYIIDEWVPDESITLRKNPNYFRAGEGLPKFDRVIFRFTGQNANAYIAAILAGECDIVNSPLGDQIELLLELHQAGKLKATFTTGTVWEHIDFGIQHVDYDDGYQLGVDRPDFFSDVRTRQAFAMCMDRQKLVEDIFFGQSLVPDSYVPPQHPLYNPEVRQYDFDPAAGSALLEEVGWEDDDGDPGTPRVAQGVANVPDGTPLEVDYETTSSQIRQQVTAIIQDSLAQCGIKANIQLYSPGEWFAEGPEGKLLGRRYELGEFAWGTGVEPPCDLFMSDQVPGPSGEEWTSIQDGERRTFGVAGWFYPNNTGFANQDYDLACGTAFGSLPGQPQYEAAHLDAQRIFAEQLPSILLYLRNKLTATRPDMCGVIMDPTAITMFWNLEQFDYGEGCEE